MYTTAGRLFMLAAAVLTPVLPGTLAAANPLEAFVYGRELPPDPGEAGRDTLAGVDSNENGLRDDLERHIARHFGSQARVVRAVENAVIATQYGILATDDDESRHALAMLTHAGDCMGAIAADLAPYGDALWGLRRMIDDTPERREAMAAHMARVLRLHVVVPEQHAWTERCESRVDEVVPPPAA